MKLASHVPRNNTHVFSKSHNSCFYNVSEMPIFRQKQTSGHFIIRFIWLYKLRVVNPGVVSSNPRSASILSNVWQKSCDKRHSSFTNGLTVYVEKQSVAWKVCCVGNWCEKTRKHMSRWTGRRDMTENCWKRRQIKSINVQLFSMRTHNLRS